MEQKTIAVPSMFPGGLDSDRSGHFGHCDVFTLVKVESGEVKDVSVLSNPPHTEGGCQSVVNLLHGSGADAIIVGGMGFRPLMGFKQMGIQVYFDPYEPRVGPAVESLLQGRLSLMSDEQVCGGGGGHAQGGGCSQS
jgi:predicted Fe-Mo cluster-binding NifX family protein